MTSSVRGLWMACLVLASFSTLAADIAWEGVYTGEVWSNVEGGIENGSAAYLDNLDVSAEISGFSLFGRPYEAFVYGLYNNGGSISQDVGDLQTVSNIETGVSAARLYEAWLETPVGRVGSLRLGLYDVNSEFDVLDSAALFIHSAHGIGTDIGQTGRNGPSIFPVTGLAARFEWDFGGPWLGRVAVVDGVPGDPEDPGAMDVSIGGDDGALVLAELQRQDGPRRLLLGSWGYSASYPQSPGRGPDDSWSNAGVYARMEAALGSEESPGTYFVRGGYADTRFGSFSKFLGAGIEWRNPFGYSGRGILGLSVAWAEARDDSDASGIRPQREVVFEITYRARLNDWLAVQPDLQYIVNPGLRPGVDDALAIGLRLEVQLFSGRSTLASEARR